MSARKLSYPLKYEDRVPGTRTGGPGGRGGRGVLPYKTLVGMCRWMGSHFHDWIDYNGAAFSREYIE